MYCYQCAKTGKITKVLDGDSKCKFNHFAYTHSLDEDIKLIERIDGLRERRISEESNFIREFISNDRN